MALSRCFAQCVAQSRYFAQFMALSDAIALVTVHLRTNFCRGLVSEEVESLVDTSRTSHRETCNSLRVGNSNTVSNGTVLTVGPIKNVDYKSSKDVNNK